MSNDVHLHAMTVIHKAAGSTLTAEHSRDFDCTKQYGPGI